MKVFLKFVVLNLIGVFLSLALFEAGIRFYLISHNESEGGQFLDRPRLYFAPAYSSYFQDFGYKIKKGKNRFTIAVVGDSFTFAPYMQYFSSFPKVLENILNYHTKGQALVLNLGVPSYSTSHEIKIVKEAFSKYQADLVILQITLNDPELKPLRPTGLSKEYNSFGKARYQGWLKELFYYWKGGEFIADRIHNSLSKKKYIKYFKDLFSNKQTLHSFKSSIHRIANVAKKKGKNKKIVAVIFPLFGLPLDNSYPFIDIHRTVQEILNDNNIQWLDLFNSYKGINNQLLQVMPGVDRHPNEIAHRIAAEAIYLWLVKNNFLPKEFKINTAYKKRISIILNNNQPLLLDKTIK